MTTYKITIKEVDNDHLLHPSYTGDVDEQFIIDWFGLENPDVEWYKIKKIEN